MKHLCKIISGIIMAGVMFAAVGCGGNGLFRDPEQNDPEQHLPEIIDGVDFAADENYSGELTVWINSEPDQKLLMDKLLEGFEAKYPNVEVELEQQPSSGYLEQIKYAHSSAMMTGNYEALPDVFWTNNGDLIAQADLDILMPLDFFDEYDDAFAFDDLIDAMVEDASTGGHVYMMPRDNDCISMYVNEELLGRAGVTIPYDRAMTKTEFMDVLAALKRANLTNKVPGTETTVQVFPLDAAFGWESVLWPLVRAYGGSVVELNEAGETVVTLNNDKTVAAFEYVVGMSDKTGNSGYFHSIENGQNGTLFKAGQAVFWFGSRATLSTVTGVLPSVNVVPMPNLAGDDMENYYVGTGCSGYGMYRYTKNKTAAWLFLKYVTSAEGQNAMCSTGNTIPVLRSLYEDETAIWRTVAIDTTAEFNYDAYSLYTDNLISAKEGYVENIKPASAAASVSEFFSKAMTKSLTQRRDASYYIEEAHESIADAIEKALIGV